MSVLFAVMPFVQIAQPSLACQLLASTLRTQGVNAEVRYYTLDFARRIGVELYSKFANYYPQNEFLLGEMLFSQVLNETDLSAELNRKRDFLLSKNLDAQAEFLQSAIDLSWQAEVFIEWVANDIERIRPKVLALSSMFQQHTAILALAKRVRKLLPDVFIVVGGSNCEGEMGYETLTSFEFLDCVISGPGEIALTQLVDAIICGKQLPSLCGVFYAKHRPPLSRSTERAEEPQIENLVIPEFEEYFEQLAAYSDLNILETTIPLETSRGCWWGERSHCTFCGLNGGSMKYRQKSPDRALSEMRQLRSRHPKSRLVPVDNILSLEYFETLMPRLTQAPLGPLFYEVKANLKRSQITMLRQAGVDEIQPGIESLSDAALIRMKKGVSAAQNVFLLLMCGEEGIDPVWNLLYGFPGEDQRDYQSQIELIPYIVHLRPPSGFGLVRLDRFSPMFTSPSAFGISKIEPVEAYCSIFPNLDGESRTRLAYYFEAYYPEKDRFSHERRDLRVAIERWTDKHLFAQLSLINIGAESVIVDTRFDSGPRLLKVDSRIKRFFEDFREPLVRAKLNVLAKRIFGLEGYKEALGRIQAAGLIFEIGNRVVPLVQMQAPVNRVLASLLGANGDKHFEHNGSEGEIVMAADQRLLSTENILSLV